MQPAAPCAKSGHSPGPCGEEPEAKPGGLGVPEAGAACIAMGSSKVQAALVGNSPPPALSIGKALIADSRCK